MGLILEFLSNDEMKKQFRLLVMKLTKKFHGKLTHNPEMKAKEGQGSMFRFNPGIKTLDRYLLKDGFDEIMFFMVPAGTRISTPISLPSRLPSNTGAPMESAGILISVTGSESFTVQITEFLREAYDQEGWGFVGMSAQRMIKCHSTEPTRYERTMKIVGLMKDSDSRTSIG